VVVANAGSFGGLRDLPRFPSEHLVAEEANLQRVDPRHPLDSLTG
jgi:hypothetical protein